MLEPQIPSLWRGGRPPRWSQHATLNAIVYVLRGGIEWRLLQTGMLPKNSAFGWFSRQLDDGPFARLDYSLAMEHRERVGSGASPVADVLDCQSVNAAENGGSNVDDASTLPPSRPRPEALSSMVSYRPDSKGPSTIRISGPKHHQGE